MHDDLLNIKAAVEGGDFELARTLADAFVAENPDLFGEMATKSVTELVEAVDVFRAANMDEECARVEAWLLHHYEPQQIGGNADAQVRIV